MIPLNLPIYDAKIKKDTNGKLSIYDEQRCRFVRLTPEEWVRQNFVSFLKLQYRYPKGLIANEVSISFNNRTFRADTVIYDNTMTPVILVEYKAPNIELTQKVVDQILLYDIKFQVRYLIISNGLKHLVWEVDNSEAGYFAIDKIPEVDVLYAK